MSSDNGFEAVMIFNFSVTHYLNYVNKTAALEEGYWSVCLGFLTIEVLLLFLSIPFYIVIFYLNDKCNQYHANLKAIYSIQCISHIFYFISRIIQIYLAVTAQQSHEHSYEYYKLTLYITCSYINTMVVYMATFIPCCMIFERVLATVFLRDYESKSRIYIRLFCAVFLIFIGMFCSFTFHTDNLGSTSYPQTITSLFVISFSYLANIGLGRVNRLYYRKSQNRSNVNNAYSLKERFQIAENIRTAKIWDSVVLLTCGFNFVAAVILIQDNFSIASTPRTILMMIFNFSFIGFSIFLPILIFSMYTSWQQEFQKLRKSLFEGHKTDVTNVSVASEVQLKNTLGNSMTVTRREETNHYFATFNKDWS